MTKTFKKYDVTQCVLYKCRNKRRLEGILQIKKYDLDKLAKTVRYYTFYKNKQDGGSREINAPELNLKKIQKRILNLIGKINRPQYLMSGEKGKSYIDNGKLHQQSNYFLTVDIKKFYDNCNREPVYRFFIDYLKTSSDIAGVLSDIVTHKKGIPTGSPTSQLIAYYGYREMFAEINNISEKYGCLFSLYVDDMTFSSKEPIVFEKLKNEVDIILRKYSHRPKYSKVKQYSKNDCKPVTGVIISNNHEILLPNKLRYKIYTNFQEIKKFEVNTQLSAEQNKLIDSLRGQLVAAKSIDTTAFPNISKSFKDIIDNHKKSKS